MGTTGSSDTGKLNSALPDIIARVREYATVPLAVGFGVATREHFDHVAGAGADGVRGFAVSGLPFPFPFALSFVESSISRSCGSFKDAASLGVFDWAVNWDDEEEAGAGANAEGPEVGVGGS